jgi:hypothetical protein
MKANYFMLNVNSVFCFQIQSVDWKKKKKQLGKELK